MLFNRFSFRKNKNSKTSFCQVSIPIVYIPIGMYVYYRPSGFGIFGFGGSGVSSGANMSNSFNKANSKISNTDDKKLKNIEKNITSHLFYLLTQ